MKIEGVITAIVSPFKNSGQLDRQSYNSLLQHQWSNGVRSLVINGTTGESPSLEWDDVEKLVQWTKEFDQKFQIIVGAGGNATSKVVDLAKRVEVLGVDAILSVVPYYNKPTQEGMFQHFSKIAASVKIPVVLYNVPGRTITSLELETIQRLSKIGNIVGIKEASGDPDFIKNIVNEIPGFTVLSGDDGSYLQSALYGCHGVISVISHVIPKQFVEWTNRAKQGDKTVISEYENYLNFCDLLFAEPNPVPVKKCLMSMKIINDASTRLPLVECSVDLSQKLEDELSRLELV